MKKWPLILATLIIVIILAALAYWIDWWLPPLFAFLTDDENSAFIQTLTDAVQIVISTRSPRSGGGMTRGRSGVPTVARISGTLERSGYIPTETVGTS